MASPDLEVAVIGAGPHGLSAAVHLRRAGVDAHVLGDPMSFWRSMPKGMRLRSNMSATNMVEPIGPLSLASYMDETGEHFGHPVSLRRFVDYGSWVQRNGVPDVDTRAVTRLTRNHGGFALDLGDGERLTAQRVVVAAGIAAFERMPAGFAHLPSGLVSHTGHHADLAVFAGRRVAVVGAGQSAFESAVLMSERGAEVELLVRAPEVVWLRSWSPIHFIGPLGRIVYAPTDVGPLWYSRLVATPALFTRLPRETQDQIAYRSIRPACSYFVKVRFDGVKLTLATQVTSAEATGDALRLNLSDGTTREVDHLMFGTGYEVDIKRYPFLSSGVLSDVRTVDGYPVLGRGLETSVPGLHILGAPAARSFGPTMRFVSGSWYAGSQVARAAAGRRVRGRRLRRPGRAALAVIRDPVEGVERVREKIINERERRAAPTPMKADADWEESLHALLGVKWPCDVVDAFAPLWSETVGSLEDSGLEVGRGSFSGWDDGDAGLARAAWCLTHHLRPLTVVETGVARGFTTRVILEALQLNGAGQLYSVDLPPPLEQRRLANEVGAAVTDVLRPRWTLIEGSSRRRLPGLLDELGTIDLFIHDSRHTHRNVSFELQLAWNVLRPGGFLLADDVHFNSGFIHSVQAFGRPPAIVCASDDQRGMFGVIQKPALTTSSARPETADLHE